MSCFSSNSTGATVAEPDPTKHVNYALGMVLGVDDFNQEFAYLSGRDQWMARDLIGYGTVRGLQVAIDDSPGANPRIRVEPGVAVSPRGQMICVPSPQCAFLGEWLISNAKDLLTRISSPLSADLSLYVVLCYRDCPTDEVPIAGEPCRSEDQLKAASRITDDFCLELRTTKPNQREENAVRDFAQWLSQVEIGTSGSVPLDQFLQAIRDAAFSWLTSPPSSPPSSPPTDFMFGSPPAWLHIDVGDAAEYMRAAFRVWVTELRPKWIARWHGCAPANFASDDAAEENCVLLAELKVPLTLTSPITITLDDQATVIKNEDERPYVVHLRMVQEWLLESIRADVPVTLNGDAVGPLASNVVQGLQKFPIDPTAPKDKQLLAFSGGKWTPTDPPPPPPPPPPIPNLSGDVVNPLTSNVVQGLQKSPIDPKLPKDKQILTFTGGKWTPTDPAAQAIPNLGGDVVNTLANNKVQKLQSVPLDVSGAVIDGQVLTARSGKLHLEALPAPAPQVVSGSFVEHPQGLPKYAIVAAGIVRSGSSRGPVYNSLRVVKVTPKTGDIQLTFDQFRTPDDSTFEYIVKVLVVLPKAGFIPIVSFRNFLPRNAGFVINVLNAGQADPTMLDTLELMVEVSRYEGISNAT